MGSETDTCSRIEAMNCLEEAFVQYHRAIDIAAGYLVHKGYSERRARDEAKKRIVPLFNNGERRPLRLANLAISGIERQEQINCQRRR
jgi:hypothetical protein